MQMNILRVRKKQNSQAEESIVQDKEITFFVNGKPTKAYQGETIHAALICAGYRQLRKSKTNQPRGVFCGMGVCFECLVTIGNGIKKQACTTLVEEGLEVHLDDL